MTKSKGAMTNAQLADAAQRVESDKAARGRAQAWHDSLGVIRDPGVFEPLFNGVIVVVRAKDEGKLVQVPEQYRNNNDVETGVVLAVGPGYPSERDVNVIRPCAVQPKDVVLLPSIKNMMVLGKTPKGQPILWCQDTAIVCRVHEAGLVIAGGN